MRLFTALVVLVLGALVMSCDIDITPAQPIPTVTLTPPLPTKAPPTLTPRPTSTPAPTATPKVELQSGSAIVVGGEVRTRSQPSSKSEMVGFIGDRAKVEVSSRAQGENWLIGAQTWVTVQPAWATEWLKLSDGTFVYSPFVFILQPGEVSPVADVPAGEKKWVDVNLRTQTARAMIGDKAVFSAPISSGAAPFDTPTGSFQVQPDGRVAVEKMTATQAGYDPRQTQYDVERVLFTQYFDQGGNALHLNYWRPHSVFGRQATSHGCIGMELHEAQYFWLFAQAGTPVEIHK